jgi:hypothetical protein
MTTRVPVPRDRDGGRRFSAMPRDAVAATSGTDVVGVDERSGIVTGRFRAAPLLRPQRLGGRREPRNLELELAPIARRKFARLGIKWLTGNRAHGSRLLACRSSYGGHDRHRSFRGGEYDLALVELR